MRFTIFFFCFIPFILSAQMDQKPVKKLDPKNQGPTPEEEQETIMGEGPMETDPEVMQLRGDETFDTGRPEEAKGGWTDYKKNDFTISYPQDWELNTEGLMGTALFVFSPLEDESDDFKENLNLYIQDLNGAPMTMDQYVDASTSQMASAITDYKLNFSKRASKNGREFHHFSHLGKQGIFDLEFEQQIYLANGKAYILTFTREVDSPSKWQDIATDIFKNFELAN